MADKRRRRSQTTPCDHLTTASISTFAAARYMKIPAFLQQQYSSLILTVDLSCPKCYDKIKKVLCKYEDRWDIRSVVWDEKNNKITLTGPFCPRKLSKKLCKKACKVIESYDIPDLCECEKEKPKSKPAEPTAETSKPTPAKPAEPKKADPPKPETPAKPKKDPPKPENAKAAPPAPKPEAAPPPKTDRPAAPSPPQPKPAVPAVPDPYPPVWPVCFGGPWCQCGAGGGYPPWGCNDNCGCRCGHGGAGGGHVCGRPYHAACRVEFFCEEDSSCRPM